MAEIPIPDNYKPGKRLGKKRYKKRYNAKDDKNQTASPSPQSEDEPIKTHISVEELESKFPFMVEERNKVLKGDIEWPTEFDKFISEEPKNADELIQSQIAWIAKASAYIAMHLKRWAEEKVVDEIDYWYKKVSNPFTGRVMEIMPVCENILDVLPARLPDFQQRFREKYEQLVSVAKSGDKERIDRIGRAINNFKYAAYNFYGIVMMIHSEAFETLGMASGGKARETKKDGAYTKEALALATLKTHPDWTDTKMGTNRQYVVVELKTHPDWTDTKIAKHIGVNRTTLYNWPDFQKAKDILKQSKQNIPHGSKDSENGSIEAYD